MKTRFDEAGILGPHIFHDIVVVESPKEVQEQAQPAEEEFPELKKKEKKGVTPSQIASVAVCCLVTMIWMVMWLQTNQLVPMLFFVGTAFLSITTFFVTLMRATQS